MNIFVVVCVPLAVHMQLGMTSTRTYSVSSYKLLHLMDDTLLAETRSTGNNINRLHDTRQVKANFNPFIVQNT